MNLDGIRKAGKCFSLRNTGGFAPRIRRISPTSKGSFSRAAPPTGAPPHNQLDVSRPSRGRVLAVTSSSRAARSRSSSSVTSAGRTNPLTGSSPATSCCKIHPGNLDPAREPRANRPRRDILAMRWDRAVGACCACGQPTPPAGRHTDHPRTTHPQPDVSRGKNPACGAFRRWGRWNGPVRGWNRTRRPLEPPQGPLWTPGSNLLSCSDTEVRHRADHQATRRRLTLEP